MFPRECGGSVGQRNSDLVPSGATIFSSALCVRYIASILDLPGFWLDAGGVHADVANKLCWEMTRVLKDIGVDILTITLDHDCLGPL